MCVCVCLEGEGRDTQGRNTHVISYQYSTSSYFIPWYRRGSHASPTLVHTRFAGILSAVGIHLADIVQEAQEPCAASLEGGTAGGTNAELEDRLDRLEGNVRSQLEEQVLTSVECMGWEGRCMELRV